jgi:hypothetical protein
MTKKKKSDVRRSSNSYGSRHCLCPKCGYRMEHERGVPCSSIKCPQCGASMRGERCADTGTKSTQQE